MLTYSVVQLPSFDAAFYNAARCELSILAELRALPRDATAFEVPAGHLFPIVSARARKSATSNFGVHMI